MIPNTVEDAYNLLESFFTSKNVPWTDLGGGSSHGKRNVKVRMPGHRFQQKDFN